MTRKDYIALAAALRMARPEDDFEGGSENQATGQWRVDVGHIGDVLAADNPRFNLAKFMQACGA